MRRQFKDARRQTETNVLKAAGMMWYVERPAEQSLYIELLLKFINLLNDIDLRLLSMVGFNRRWQKNWQSADGTMKFCTFFI